MITQIRIPIRGCQRGFYLRWYYNGWHYWSFYKGAEEVLTKGEKYRTTAARQVELSSGMVTEAQIEALRTLLNSRELYIYTDGGWAECRHMGGEVVVYRNYINAYELQCKILIGSRKVSDTGYSVGELKPYEYTPPYVDPGELPSPEGLCALVVGTQIWACYNYDIPYPGSKVYANNEANRAIYGGLYNSAMIRAVDFCPAGWHVPTNEELATLNSFAGSVDGKPGVHLKSYGYTYWKNDYVPDHMGLDTYDFDLRGAGAYFKSKYSGYIFSSLTTQTNLWSITTAGSTEYFAYATHTSTAFPINEVWQTDLYASVRLIKD